MEMLAPLLPCTGIPGAQYQLAVASSTQHGADFLPQLRFQTTTLSMEAVSQA